VPRNTNHKYRKYIQDIEDSVGRNGGCPYVVPGKTQNDTMSTAMNNNNDTTALPCPQQSATLKEDRFTVQQVHAWYKLLGEASSPSRSVSENWRNFFYVMGEDEEGNVSMEEEHISFLKTDSGTCVAKAIRNSFCILSTKDDPVQQNK
jgi:hypothetical protein